MSAPTVQLSIADLTNDAGVIVFMPSTMEDRIDFHVRASRRGAAKARMVKRLTLLRMTRG